MKGIKEKYISGGEKTPAMIDILEQCETLKRILRHRAEELSQQEHLRELDAKRTDLDRRTALFVPSRQRLERGGKTLELGEEYEAIKDLREQRGKNKIRQDSLRDDMAEARTALQNAEEALTIIEAEYRDKLTEQTKLANLAQRVKGLDAQITDLQDSALQARNEYEESERNLKECSARVEAEQSGLERLELALREARKFLQTHSTDEKLQAGLSGIQKCFAMFMQADDKHTALKASWSRAIQRKLQAQSILNDRSAMFSDVNHRYAVIEKNYARARAFYESTLRGKSISEWREICDSSVKKLAELDELYKKFQEVRDLEERLRGFQDIRLRIQQETRSLNIRDVEQAGKMHDLQQKAESLEKRVALLRRIEDLDAVRELLQDGTACPLCGSITHPYTSGAVIPDPEEVHKQLQETQRELDELRDELATRQTRAGKLGEEISAVGRDESEIRKKANELNAEISSKVSILGLKISAGISPFEELDRERQRTRDTLQLARNAADTAESAERAMKAAEDELDKMRETRGEVTRFHQDALFAFQDAKAEAEQFDAETKTQAEIVVSLRRELISQVTPYGYKALPDRNPGEVVEALERRMQEWIEGSRRRDELERELSLANTKMNNLKKDREALRVKRDELAGRLKAVEADRDSVQQQRVILFASKNPDDETSRMNADVEALRAQLNERREDRNMKSQALDRVMTAVHTLETETATGREELQRHEINFSKRLLALGFRNEEDYSAACLTAEERRDLQSRLRELTQEDLDLKAERENTRAKILELQADKLSMTNDEINAEISALKDSLAAFMADSSDEATTYREKVNNELIPAIKNLMMKCGFEEALLNE